jgi:hypothetical protein
MIKPIKKDHLGLYSCKPFNHGIQQDVKKMVKAKKAEEEVEEKKVYKQPVLFLRKSKVGKHLYAFNREESEEGPAVLDGDVGSIIMDVSEVERLIAGSTDWIKIGIIPKKPEE